MTPPNDWPTLTPAPMPISRCDRWGECKDRHDNLERWVREIDHEVRDHGKSIAALKVQVAMWAAIGALAGGAIVSAFLKLVVK